MEVYWWSRGHLGLAVGAAIGILSFRGRNFWRLENSTNKTKGALDLLKNEIMTLPPDAPEKIKTQLYERYATLVDEYSRIAEESLDENKTGDGRGQRQLKEIESMISELRRLPSPADVTQNTQ